MRELSVAARDPVVQRLLLDLVGEYARLAERAETEEDRKDGSRARASLARCVEWRLRHSGRSIMRKNMVAILLSLLLVSGVVSLLSACNTTAGAGEDMRA